ncbi:MAG: glycosyltransferase family 4 protein [Patescibacteria group bacterium]
MKVLYIYSGSRKDKFKGTIGIDYPDTQFYGLNHLGKFGIETDYAEFSDVLTFKPFRWILSFRLRHIIATLYFSLKGDYDVIFGSSLVYGLLFKRLFGLKQKYVLLDISIGRTLTANRGRTLRYKFFIWLLGAAHGIVSLSNVQKVRLEQELPQFIGKVYFAHLGVDTKYHTPIFEDRNGPILSAGRDNGRDYGTVLEVARLMPEERFEIVCSRRNLAGLGEIPVNVSVTYDLPPHDLYDRFGTAEMLLLITHDDSYADGSDCSGQTVLLEALAKGLPVIASTKKYLADYVEDGKDILEVDFYDATGIVEKIHEIRAGDMAARLARNARETAASSLSTENMARELSDIFTKITTN